MLHSYWSYSTLLLYLFQGVCGMFCIYSYNKTRLGIRVSHTSVWYYFTFVLIWTFFATFRLVCNDIGGADAPDYIYFFRQSIKKNIIYEHGAEDLAFLYLNKVIRSITIDYKVYFAVVYGLMAYAYAAFVKRFTKPIFCVVPFVLLFYVYLRGYNTIRSNLTSTVILLGLIFLADKKYFKAYLLLCISAMIHKMGILFAFAIPVCHFFCHFKFKVKYALIAIPIIIGAATGIRTYLMLFFSDLGTEGAYEAYLRDTSDNSIFSSFTEFFGQWVLLLLLFFQHKKITSFINKFQTEKEHRTFNILYVLCFYDTLLTPLNTLLGIWRGYEFFYAARLCMWSMLIYMWTKNKTSLIKYFVKICFFAVFVAWMIFRLSRTYKSSALMPYVFEPFV